MNYSLFAQRWLRLILLMLGLIVQSIGVILIATASKTTIVVATEELRRNWSTTYDILVRPMGTRSPIEIEYGLVEGNHLSGVWGGISVEQYNFIKNIPGIEIAAPIAMIGYNVVGITTKEMTLPPERGSYVLKEKIFTDMGTGLSSSPGFSQKSYYYFNTDPQKIEPDPNLPIRVSGIIVDHPSTTVSGYFSFPLLIAGIDSLQEAALVGLDRAIFEGRYLEHDEPITSPFEHIEWNFGFPIGIPILINATTYINATHHAELRRVILPPEVVTVNDIMAHGGEGYLEELPSVVINTTIADSNSLYRHVIEVITDPEPEVMLGSRGTVSIPSGLVYHKANPIFSYDGLLLEIEVAEITDARHWPQYRVSSQAEYNVPFVFKVIGTFDIGKISRSSGLNQVPLETYFPPVAFLRYDEDGNPVKPPIRLYPTLDPTGFIQPPPSILTTLEAAQALLGDEVISAIRVKVKGIEHLSPAAAQRKIETITGEILLRTSLEVDIMTGSSPTRILVHVPGIGYVEEQWIKKGANLSYQEYIQGIHWMILYTLMVIGVLFALDLSWSEVVARRRTIALQKALGWRTGTVFRQVLGQIVFVGAVAAVLGSLTAWGVSILLGWEQPSPALLMGVPLLVVGLAVAGGLYPAWLAGRVLPIVSLHRGNVCYPQRKSLHLPSRGLLPYAWQGLSRRWSRTAPCGLMAALSAALLVLMLAVTVEQQGAMSGTLLGEFILVKIEGYHYAIVGIGFGLAALSLANSLLASVLERRREIGVLKAVGWRTSAVVRLFLVEGALLGLIGGLAGSALGLMVFVELYETVTPSLAWIGAVGVGLPVGVGLLAALYPARVASNFPPAKAVRYE